MAISLSKGGNISLSKEAPNLQKIGVGLGWDTRASAGASFDLDASAFLLGADGKVRSDADFIFYGQLQSLCKSVKHTGDNRTGAGDGDDETLLVDLSKVPTDVEKIIFAVTIHEYKERNQNFGMVSGAFIRVYNEDENVIDPRTGASVPKEIARFDLTEEASTVTAMIFAEIYRYNGEWKFKAVGQGFNFGLGEMATNFKVSIA